MFRSKHCLALFLFALCVGTFPGELHSAIINATWTGNAGDGKWSTPGNWDIGAVPLNDETNTYNVVIPNSKGNIVWL
jgi:hypothetical protein